MEYALFALGLLSLFGTGIVWTVGGTGTIAVTLVVIGVLADIGLVTVPLLIGQWLVRRLDGTPSEDTLRRTVTAWPIAMGVVFIVFITPGGPMQGDLLDLGGPRFCLRGFCGVSVHLVGAILLEAIFAIVGPGIIASALARRRCDDRR